MPPPPITTIFSRLKMTTAGIVTPTGKGKGGIGRGQCAPLATL